MRTLFSRCHRSVSLVSLLALLPLAGCGGELYLNADDAVSEFDRFDRDPTDEDEGDGGDGTGDGTGDGGGDVDGDSLIGDGFGDFDGDGGGGGCGFNPEPCPGGQECVEGACVTICPVPRCEVSRACCGAGETCVNDRFCLPACPNPTDERCGSTGELCCNSPTQVCGESLTCVQNCGPDDGPLCGTGTPASFGTVCCDGRNPGTDEDDDVCVFNRCVARGGECESFLDCEIGEYCELTLHEETSSGEPDTGYCLPNDFPPDAPICQEAPDDTFEPETEWSWVGIQLVGSDGNDTDFTNNFTDGQVIPKCAAAGDINCYREPCTAIPNSASPAQSANFQAQCFRNVAIVPVTADLDLVDHDPDPLIQKVVPEVVFKAYSNDAGFDLRNVLVIADGRSDEELPGTGTPSKQQRSKLVIWGATRGHSAIANLDSDPQLEIATGNMNGLCVYDPYVDQGMSPPTIAANAKRWCLSSGAMDIRYDGSAPHFADFNADGVPEIIIGGNVVRDDGGSGTLLVGVGFVGDSVAFASAGDRCDNNSECFALTTVADVNGDGLPDLLAGDKAWTIRRNPVSPIGVERITGTDGWVADRIWSASYAGGSTPQPWTIGVGRGYPSVANFVDNRLPPYNRPTDTPEVAYIYDGGVYIVSGETGIVLSSPVSGVTRNLAFKYLNARGGPPNIADFDGDGRPEVSFAGTGCMVVVDPDCFAADAAGRVALASTPNSGCNVAVPGASPPQRTCTIDVQADIGEHIGVLWQYQTQDQSSAVTGTSVFDFQGDGKAEVLYNDECFFRVFEGATADILYERPSSNRTITEYPIVVDVDGDSNSEIVITSNGDQSSFYTSRRDRCGGPALGAADGTPNCGALNNTNCSNTGGCGWNGSACVSCANLNSNQLCDPLQFTPVAPACNTRSTADCIDSGGCGVQSGACVPCASLSTNGACTGAQSSGCSWTGSACITTLCTGIRDGNDGDATINLECNGTPGCVHNGTTCVRRVNGCGWDAAATTCRQDCTRIFDGTDGNTNITDECNNSLYCRQLLNTCKPAAYQRAEWELFTPASCTCADHTQQPECDAGRGCRWNGTSCVVVTNAATAGNCGSYPDRPTCQTHMDDCIWDPFQGGTGACEENPRSQAMVCLEGTWGITTFGDTSDLWVKTLPYWFEHPFHITNQDRFGRVIPDWNVCYTGSQCAAETDPVQCEETFVSGSAGPLCEYGDPNPDFYNNFRQNVPGFVPLNAPDLQIESVVADLLTCPPQITIIARVINKGRAGIRAEDADITFYRLLNSGETALQTAQTVTPFARRDLPQDLLPGGAAIVSAIYTVPASEAPIGLDFRVIANPEFLTAPTEDNFECNNTNNSRDILDLDCTDIGG